MKKLRTWHDNWNNVIREVLFPDAELKRLMLVPDGAGIKAFIEKYFIEDALPDEPIIDESVRIVYYDTEGIKLGTPHVLKKYLALDIYVKEDALYNATRDRLQRRDKLICQRIKELLTDREHVCGLRFRYEDEYHLGAKTIGYRRYHVVFSYVTTW